MSMKSRHSNNGLTKGGTFEDAFTALGVSLDSTFGSRTISASQNLLKVKRLELEQKMTEEREESLLEQCVAESLKKKREISVKANEKNVEIKASLLNLNHADKLSNKSLESVLLNCSHNLYEKESTKGKTKKIRKHSKKQSFAKRSNKSKHSKK